MLKSMYRRVEHQLEKDTWTMLYQLKTVMDQKMQNWQ